MSSAAKSRPRKARRAGGLLRDPLFGPYWVAAAAALVVEQLLFICLTLLLVDLAESDGTIGLVLAVAAIPAAVLLPFGGVLADRFDPARLWVVCTWVRTGLLTVLSALVALGPPPVAVVAVLAAALGALMAIAVPAVYALTPRLVDEDRLPRANALLQGAESAGDLVGPALAAALAAALGLAAAFGAVTALAAAGAVAATIFARRLARSARGTADGIARPAGPPLAALAEGIRFAMSEPVVRAFLLLLAAVSFCVVGPVIVGGAVLAERRLGSPEALGIVLGAFGAGSLVGLVVAGARPPARRGLVTAAASAAVGASTAALGLAETVPAACACTVVMGVGAAYLGVILVAGMQGRAPEALRGRVMGLVAFCAVALDPLSFALAGALLPLGLTAMFAISGGLVLVAAAIAVASSTVRGLA